MPRNINFLMDQLTVDPDYEITSGNTEPNITYGFVGNVVFKPWTSFGDVIAKATTAVETLDDSQLQTCQQHLSTVREEIEEKKKTHMEIMVVESEKKRLLELGRTAGLTVNDERMEIMRQSKRKRVRGSYIRKTVTNSLSIIDIHVYVMNALKCIIKQLYPCETFTMEERTIYSQQIMEAADVDSSCASDQEDLNDEVEEQGFTTDGNSLRNSVSEGQDSKSSVQQSETLQIGQSASASAPTYSTESVTKEGNAQETTHHVLRRSKRLAAKKQAPQTIEESSAVIQLRQASDRSLFRIEAHAICEVPVCSFEFKGPCVDLTALLLDDDEVEGTDIGGLASNSTELEGTDDVRGLGSGDSNENGTTASLNPAGIEATGDQDPHSHIYMKGATAEQVASKYNQLFQKVESFDAYNPNRQKALPIAQVLCQALLSQSRCVVLTNHQYAIAFRIEESHETKKADVFVTGAIPCHEEPGCFAAMVAIAKLSLDRTIGKRDEVRIGPNKRILRRVSRAQYDKYPSSRSERLDVDWHPGRGGREEQALEENTADSSAQRSTHGCPEVRSRFKDTSLMQREENVSSGFDDTGANCYDANYAVSSPKSEGLSSVFGTEMVISGIQNRSLIDKYLSHIFATVDGILAVGGSGLILRGIMGKKEVAVKIWNGESSDGFLSIRNEIRIFKKIQKKCASILGDAVPRLVLGWDSPDQSSVYRKEVILVTELVGHEILMGEDGCLWLEDEYEYHQLTKNDTTLVQEEALKSLNKLHKNGFAHGDVSLQNIRVKRRLDRLATGNYVKWMVWWVDLGHASELPRNGAEYSYHVRKERQACSFLFRTKNVACTDENGERFTPMSLCSTV